MNQFIQFHLLTSYAPSNLNRDDLGRPKTAKMGGFERLRVSSQSLKRSWRTSDLFEKALEGEIGARSRSFGQVFFEELLEKGIEKETAFTWVSAITNYYNSGGGEKTEKDKKEKKAESIEEIKKQLELKQLVHLTPREQEDARKLLEVLVTENRSPTKDELQALYQKRTCVDIALFGRMLASSPEFNIEAACQVAHAISVHAIAIEDDYFTAVDDLNEGRNEMGSAHIGESGFAAALFYTYLCINKSLLLENLNGDEALVNRALKALTEAIVKVSPTGKQNSFASRSYASYLLAEKGTQQPRSLSVAFLKPIQGDDIAINAIAALKNQTDNFDKVYGNCVESRYSFNAITGEGSFAELADFIAS